MRKAAKGGKGRRYVVMVKVRDVFVRSGNCPGTYATKATAEKAIKRDGIGYMEYRVERVRRQP